MANSRRSRIVYRLLLGQRKFAQEESNGEFSCGAEK